MLQLGDKVWIEDSAQIDVGFMAWQHVKDHRYAEVKAEMAGAIDDIDDPKRERVYALEFEHDFLGGLDCYGNCAKHRGQFVTEKHLSLCFEASREVQTVPNIERPASTDFAEVV